MLLDRGRRNFRLISCNRQARLRTAWSRTVWGRHRKQQYFYHEWRIQAPLAQARARNRSHNRLHPESYLPAIDPGFAIRWRRWAL